MRKMESRLLVLLLCDCFVYALVLEYIYIYTLYTFADTSGILRPTIPLMPTLPMSDN